MLDLIGRLDEGTLHAEMTLPTLEPLMREYQKMTHGEVIKNPDPNKGVAQLFYPGPVVTWYSIGSGGKVHLQIYNNGGNVKLSDELVGRLTPHVIAKES